MRNISGLSENGIGSFFLGSRRGPLSWDFTGGSLPAGITFTRAGSATYFDAAGVLQIAAADQPRFDHDPVSGALRGLLVEPSATNRLTYSSDFVNAAWSKANATVTANTATAPDGTLTAHSLVQASGERTLNVDFPRFFNYDIGDVCLSVIAKQSAARYLAIGFSNGAGLTATAVFDLQTGVLSGAGFHPSTCSSVSTSIAHLGAGWYRCSLGLVGSANAVGTAHIASTIVGSSGIYSRVITGDGTSGIFIWGAHLEKGATPTSYIPTTTAAATRAADQPRITANLGIRDVRVTTEAGVQVLTAQALTGSYWPALTGPQRIRKIEVL